MISFEEFKKVELRVAEILAAGRVEGSDKLLKLKASLGEDERQIIAGIGKNYEPEGLVGKKVIIVANLEPRSLLGLESQGMILATSNEEGRSTILTPESDNVAPGTLIT
ncbi:MAG TPA: methionine--tRNA ligase subunit beta [Candidatus Paceibacterota bacterium]|jgi:methionyl-tRNA synthetase|nr:methionine--tRNA ligase subunit beta [Candidatus Paceibacterota bacterium]HOH11108.1 methionine--tRNA ligase subunit beta [Candidatus Paceibacterota bacterium]HOY11143.1 methionine--tRNA ligase subunit beta [Candidatus Paceibacterota bacterium]HPB60713.1 methionine--tRNA ligase subunit beta [Candidatus Paceibacterota bacterium]HPN89652.1 methionine--tRNA ligase subunit beta [Candidatus Paceibacterota bacterium]